jgi:hypothetical protein
LESVNVWKNYKKWIPSISSAGASRWCSSRVSGSASLPDPVTLETEEQRLQVNPLPDWLRSKYEKENKKSCG